MKEIHEVRALLLKHPPIHKELKLLQDPENALSPLWQEIMAIRAKIVEEKRTALNAIDAKYQEQLQHWESHYALLLSMMRG